ncbi:hypothetical protein PF002_g30539 [Phytophthora fragariae]|uniref:Uncharacterized protein n=1 Tax=Phytophthora fragariae TaxID=53985 RepID=A0A6A3VMQ9_9STRA|nr:hypothetical protein PF002_g30539 [Phytophthora fragariae]
MPPAAVSELRCDSFQLPRTRVKGEYYPPLAHQLAAHRLFRDLSSETGRWLSPMSFVLHLRELECVRFDAPPAVLMALYSGRLGSRGLTVMHFRPQSEMEQLERGSSNANFSADFGAGATLPATTVDCPTYEDLLAAIGGLISFGDALCYDHARRLRSRVKRFVLANLERDHNTHERVMLTVMFVNQFIGRALAHLLVDSPHWWRNFNEAVRAVDYHSPDWQAALNGLALRMASTPARASNGSQPVQPPRPGGAPSRRGPAARTPIMPERIRRLIPRDRDGREPCLRFMGGDDYRPNKRMLPDVIRTACRGYQHLDALLAIADSGVRAPVSEGMLHQHVYPTNHKSAADRYPVLIKNIRKEQDLWRCFVLDLDILGI